MKSEIFKIQKPMYSSISNAPYIVYNKSRSFYGEVEATPELSTLMGLSYKIYVKGYVNNDGILNIDYKVPKQKW